MPHGKESGAGRQALQDRRLNHETVNSAKMWCSMKAEPGEEIYEKGGKRYVIRWSNRLPGEQEPIEVEVE